MEAFIIKKGALTKAEKEHLLTILKERFDAHTERHASVRWEKIEEKLHANPKNLKILWNMEHSGGEPDVVLFGKTRDAYVFVDCVKESPAGRRSLCYDMKARKERKEHAPQNSAIEFAQQIGVTLLTEAEYMLLQKKVPCDSSTSSWLLSDAPIRQRGGAIFGDRRFDRVFIYHNGAQSYYANRGFRGKCVV